MIVSPLSFVYGARRHEGEGREVRNCEQTVRQWDETKENRTTDENTKQLFNSLQIMPTAHVVDAYGGGGWVVYPIRISLK